MKLNLHILFLALFFVASTAAIAQPCPGPSQRTALLNLQRANVDEGTRAGQIPLTDTCGNQRYAQYVEINLSPIGYVPATTGNALNLSEFVISSVDTGLYYIDWQGNAIKFGAGGGGGGTCDVDWLEIGPNTCPNHINDSIYTYSYVAVGARYVWPTAEFLVNDSTATAVSVISGSRNARLVFHDNQGGQYSTVDQSGASTLWYIQPGGEWRVLTAASGTPENPLGPFVNQLGINPVDSTVQIYRYPNTRIDTQAVRNFLYTDPVGKIRSQSLDSLIVIIVDSIASDTALQYNWYTRDDTTTSAMRTATILNSAQWLGDAVGGSLLLEMGALAGGRLLIDTAATLFNTGLGGTNIVRARPQGVLINTSNTATRSVWLVTDSLNWGGSFSPTRLRINFRSDSTYMFADSFQTVALGRFPSFPASSGGRGLYYAPGTTDGVRLLNRSADGLTRTMVELDPFSSIWETAGPTASVQGSEVAINENGQLNFTTQRNSSIYGSIQHNAITNSNEEVTALTQNGRGVNLTASMFLGKGYASSQVYKDTARAWGVESHLSVGSFAWLKARLPNDTLGNQISFYNDAYFWKNEKPTGVPGDTIFHYWAEDGVNAGKLPGFITLSDIRGPTFGENWYNTSSTTTDSNRVADVLYRATWRSNDVTFNGNVPFRFELTGGPENEPEIMVWKFPLATDSLLLAKSDFEIYFRSTNKFLLWSDADMVFLADSITANFLESVDSVPFIVAQTAPGVLKRFDASDAGAGGVLTSTGTNWRFSTPTGLGYILQGGNSFGTAMVIGTNDNNALNFEVNGVTGLTMDTNYALTATASVAATNTSTNRLIISTNSTGTPTIDFGSNILFRAESSTTDNTDQSYIESSWLNATHSNKSSALVLGGWRANTWTPFLSVSGFGVSITGSGNYDIQSTSARLRINNGLSTADGLSLLSSTNAASSVRIGVETNVTATSGHKKLLNFATSFIPTSGTADFTNIAIEGIINQSSGGTGITRGILIQPSFNSPANYRAIDIQVNQSNGRGIFQQGSNTSNNFEGKLAIGTTSVPSDNLEVTGNVALMAAGNKLKIATGANASAGTATLSGGTVTVNTTAVTSSSLIYLTFNTPSGTQGFLSAPSGSIVNGTSFTINSSSGSDDSTVNWWLIN